MIEFKRTGDADYPRWMKIVNLAMPKAGKTTFEATAPNNVILATPNAGLMSIAHLNLPYVQISASEELRQILAILQSDALRKQAAEQWGLPVIETVSLDLLDDVQQILQKERLRSERRTAFQRDDWGWLLDQMREIIKAFVALPMNVIFSVHIKSSQDDEGRIITAPGLQGAISDELAGYVDFVVMSQRNREIDPQTGKPFIKYTLKVEGDLKNPHLGNRAAGRLPEVVEPDFKVLHDAVFKGIESLPKTTTVTQAVTQTDVQIPDAATTSEEVAQPSGQPAPAQEPAQEPQPVAEQAPAAPATPPSDSDQPINDAGIKHVTNFYKEFGYTVPDFTGWTLGEARNIARMFVAVKGDAEEGKGSRDDMRQFLQAIQAEKSFQVWVEPAAPTESAPQPAAEPPAPVSEPVTPEVEATDVNASAATEAAPVESNGAAPQGADATADTSDRDTQEAEALQAIEQTLGGKQIGVVESDEDPCQKCGGPIDDHDIAVLAKARFGVWACVKDYVELTKQPA